MRFVPVLFLAALTASAFADEATTARRRAEARRLLQVHVTAAAAEIAGFNRRQATCAKPAADVDAAYDAAHAARFTRTLGWRWDAARARFVPASGDEAEVRMRYRGPVFSGTVTIDGRETSFCRAEMPDELESSWRRDVDADGLFSWLGDTAVLPKLAPARAGPQAEPVASWPSTSRAEREARIAEAIGLLRAEREGIEAHAKSGPAPTSCVTDQADKGVRTFDWIKGMRREHDKWVMRPGATDAELEMRMPWNDERTPELVCLAFRPATVIARATWQDEGENVLTFRVDLSGKPAR